MSQQLKNTDKLVDLCCALGLYCKKTTCRSLHYDSCPFHMVRSCNNNDCQYGTHYDVTRDPDNDLGEMIVDNDLLTDYITLYFRYKWVYDNHLLTKNKLSEKVRSPNVFNVRLCPMGLYCNGIKCKLFHCNICPVLLFKGCNDAGCKIGSHNYRVTTSLELKKNNMKIVDIINPRDNNTIKFVVDYKNINENKFLERFFNKTTIVKKTLADSLLSRGRSKEISPREISLRKDSFDLDYNTEINRSNNDFQEIQSVQDDDQYLRSRSRARSIKCSNLEQRPRAVSRSREYSRDYSRDYSLDYSRDFSQKRQELNEVEPISLSQLQTQQPQPQVTYMSMPQTPQLPQQQYMYPLSQMQQMPQMSQMPQYIPQYLPQYLPQYMPQQQQPQVTRYNIPQLPIPVMGHMLTNYKETPQYSEVEYQYVSEQAPQVTSQVMPPSLHPLPPLPPQVPRTQLRSQPTQPPQPPQIKPRHLPTPPQKKEQFINNDFMFDDQDEVHLRPLPGPTIRNRSTSLDVPDSANVSSDKSDKFDKKHDVVDQIVSDLQETTISSD